MNRREFIAGAGVSALAARLLWASGNIQSAGSVANANHSEVPLSLRFDRSRRGVG